ncbi:hypothetical protein [Streptomyces wuyuanensis]|uniref:hypothetical protein n=1 Tax=Streptomyces wuyuanensis TaxID=1196353 RepID=UPI003423E85B
MGFDAERSACAKVTDPGRAHQEADINGHDFQVGDILRVDCPPARARVTAVGLFEVSIEWPWGEMDAASDIRWNGLRAVPRPDDPDEWPGLFQIASGAAELNAGDFCLAGIPESSVRVIDIGHYEPPADVGWLPRPATMLIVVPTDRAHGALVHEGDTIELPSAAPISIKRISSP